MDSINVIKVGGGILEDETSTAALLDRFAALPGKKVLVHGGGRSATRIAAQLGVESRMVEGRRITDEAMLRVVSMVYGGLVNKNVVARLQAAGVNALGLTGADMDIIRSHRRPVRDGIDFGFVGDVDRVDADRLALLLESGVVPVVAPLTHDGQGNLLNTNADTMAGEVAKALAQHFDVTLVYCFEHNGVLAQADDERSVIPLITPEIFHRLKTEGVVSGGMLPKLENCLAAVEAGVGRVVITRADALGNGCGTRIALA